MILLQLKLSPSGVASKFVFFMAAKAVLLVAVVLAGLLLPTLWGVFALVLWGMVQVGYYIYVYRLCLCIFTLAQKAEEAGQPVGRPSSSRKASKVQSAKDMDDLVM